MRCAVHRQIGQLASYWCAGRWRRKGDLVMLGVCCCICTLRMPILLDGVRSDGLLTATCEAAATTAVPSFAWDMVLPMGASTICAAAAFVTKELILLLSLVVMVFQKPLRQLPHISQVTNAQ